jgi:hypothetical protein
MAQQSVRVVWSVENVATGADEVIALDEAAAIEFARSQAHQIVGHYVVARRHLVAGRVV